MESQRLSRLGSLLIFAREPLLGELHAPPRVPRREHHVLLALVRVARAEVDERALHGPHARRRAVVAGLAPLLADLDDDVGRVEALARLLLDQALRGGRHLLRDLVAPVGEQRADAVLLVLLVPPRALELLGVHAEGLHDLRDAEVAVLEEHAGLDALRDGPVHVDDHLDLFAVVLGVGGLRARALAVLLRAVLARREFVGHLADEGVRQRVLPQLHM